MNRFMTMLVFCLAVSPVANAQWTRAVIGDIFPTNTNDRVTVGPVTGSGAKFEVNFGDVILNSANGGRTQFTNPNGAEGLSIFSPFNGIGNNRADMRFNGADLRIGCHDGVGPMGPVPTSNLMIMTTGGNVGFGVNSPTAKVDVISENDVTFKATNSKVLGGLPKMAVWGESSNIPFEGLGGFFDGGHIGVLGQVVQNLDVVQPTNAPGINDAIKGVMGHADNFGTENSRWAIGVFGQGYITNENGTAIGVYGRAGNTHQGMNNDWAVFADGFTFEATGTGMWTSSDARLKKNVENIESGLDMINRLQPKTYEYKTDGKFATAHFARGKIYGFLAQDLEKVIPEMVATAPIIFNGDDKDDANDYSEEYKSVSYQMLIPILTQAIKEQQQEIVVLRDEVMKMKEANVRQANTTTINGNMGLGDGSTLMQNVPNPFSVSTEIPYRLADGVGSAHIYVCDLNGKLVKKYNIAAGNKEGTVNITADNLADGMYIYTLVANDNIVDSKRMLIAK